MTEWLEKIDQDFVLWVNGLHTPFLDEFFWLISSKWIWIPFYLLLIFLFYRKNNWYKTIYFVLFAVLSIGIADLISVHLFKEVFMRYRPSHNLNLTDKLHYYQFSDGSFYQGGQFGFISSHAANFAALFTWSGLHLYRYYRKFPYVLVIIFLFVIVSRIYLGVHYLSDVLAGGVLGAIIGYVLFRLTKVIFRQKKSQ